MQWNLVRLRKEAGLSQEELAKIIGINKTTYSNKERGVHQFQANEMFLLKDYFDKNMDDIFLPTDCNNIALSDKVSKATQ
ncbi:transcriptional regulator [Sporosarcina sp. P21c]|uniref:helix-turn-helix transcriptional regulator n=1 Tax=Sporosarcina sp. P21c TaxID=2048255 RepID=UPI000C16810D|nr:helix-turn-helix transcriptional regulator [Sporosarcina sp. P21c]PIC88399.1 transcriptional regulator [Sporosarcina sp. P21c]